MIELTNANLIISRDNTFKYCYTASQGAIFKLTTCTEFRDDAGTGGGSVYSNNAALQGGAVYFDRTEATFT